MTDIYEKIKKEIFSDPFYSDFQDYNKKFTAWFLLNVYLMGEDLAKDCIFLSRVQNYVDAVFADENKKIVHVIKCDFRSGDSEIDITAFKQSLHFFKYLVQPVEFQLTDDRKLNREYYHIQDCMEKKYTLLFEYVTPALLTGAALAEYTREKSAFATDGVSEFLGVEVIDGNAIREKYEGDEEEVEVSDKPRINLNLFSFIAEQTLSDEDSEGYFDLSQEILGKWSDENVLGMDEGLFALREFALFHHAYAVFQCFCIHSEINDNRLPSPALVMERLRRDVMVDNAVSLAGKCLNDAYLKAKEAKGEAGLSPREWIKNGDSLSGIKKAVYDYFQYLAFMTRGTREVLASYQETFLFAESEFTLHLKEDLKYEELFAFF